MNYIFEQRIWDYVDGNSNPQERKRVEKLIASDPEYQAAYQEILAINDSLQQMEMDQPSLSFTRNVMEKVKTEPIPGSIKSLVDKRIVNGLFIFFLTVIAALLAITFIQADWSQPVISDTLPIKVPKVSLYLSENTTNWLLNGFFFADAIVGLYVLDYYLRKKIGTNK